MRNAPDIKFSKREYDATFLCSGYDTIEESASVFIFEQTWQNLENAKEYARSKNTGSNQAYTTKLGGMEFQIKPHGGDGVAFILSNNLFTVLIRPAKVDFNLSVSYRARTLWEYGADEARRMIWSVLLREMKPRPPENENEDADITSWRRVSRVDYAMDFHAPEMTDEIGADMIERVVCHSSSKVRYNPKFKIEDEEGEIWGTSARIQTITIGKKNTLQVQLYKKSDEITEKSGKTWMYKIYENVGLEKEKGVYDDIWRVEVRFGREYLAARNINEFEDFEHHREKLLCEALKSRRLTDRTDDSNRRRWPVHPMWSQAIEMAGNAMFMISLEDHKERAARVLKEKIEQDIKAALRRYSYLETGSDEYDWMAAHNLCAELVHNLDEDDNHDDKMKEYAERYKYIDHAR